ncbi:MAG: prolyl oligopeptidase family serine peptidase [Candidatus Methylacidiphilales bacterium]|nr:prolyl oligopeptidase family serine peptidase [Candidatus Methylacidiphilales bacterium]
MSLAAFLCLVPGWTQASETRIHPEDLDSDGRLPDERMAYKTVDGIDLPMAVFLPRAGEDKSGRRPVILCLHGGAWSGWKGGDVSAWDGGVFAPHARYFAARGAVGVTISYRHVPRPDKDNEKEAFEKGPSLFDLLADCRSALRTLRKNADRLGIDPDRIAVIGDSAGGHLAACLGTIDRFDNPGDDLAVSGRANLTIPCNPITDLLDPKWRAFVPNTPRFWEANEALGLNDRARAISPMWNITPQAAPSLLLHGLGDSVVDPRHSSEFQAKLKAAGVRGDLFTLPKAGHAFILFGYRSTGAEWLDAMRAVDAFLVSMGYLQGKANLQPDSPQNRSWSIAGDQMTEGRIAGKAGEGVALHLPALDKAGVTTAGLVADPQRGQVIQVGRGRGGLELSGCPHPGTATTVASWILPDKPSGTLYKRGTLTGTGTGCKWVFGPGGVLTLHVAGASLTTKTPLPSGWVNVAFTVSPERAIVYINGQVVAEQALQNAVLIGPRVAVAEDFSGRFSDLFLADHALTAEEVAALADPRRKTPNPL